MRDLLIFVRELLIADKRMKALFLAAGYESVKVIQPDQSAIATYPKVILDTEEGTPETFAENAAPKILNGRLRIEIVAATTDKPVVDATMMRKDLGDLCAQLLLGYGANTPPVQGRRFDGDSGARWCVTMLRQVRVRSLPVTDPLFSRAEIVFSVQLCRQS